MQASARVVLVVEDDADIREVLEEMLDAGGHRVLTASNGREALAALDRVVGPCLVLLDLMMPVMSGFAFLEELELREDRERMNVVLMSANVQLERVARSSGVVGFVKKPFDMDEVLALVDSHAR
jgi:two-component system chemotaxis response regulator CheY